MKRRMPGSVIAALACVIMWSNCASGLDRLFDGLTLVDEIDCSKTTHNFKESTKGASKVETILGRQCRVMPNQKGAQYFAYRIGTGKGLTSGGCYVLTVDFPEDKPRTLYIINRGCEFTRGLHTGATVGDAINAKYVNGNPESLKIPLSGAYETFESMFFLHDRFSDITSARGGKNGSRPFKPADGFWVIIAQMTKEQAPKSTGAAASHIRLYAVPDYRKYFTNLRLPPTGLPQRHLFWREEMSDGVVNPRSKPVGVDNHIDWFEYKARLMRVWGMNTFSKDLLEFGHNQGWESHPNPGNSEWYNQSATPKRWQQILAMIPKYGLNVMPYYEYMGSIGQKTSIGTKKKCMRLDGGKQYTHIKWTEKANADITDPEIYADAKKLLDLTIRRHADKVKFVGAWFRTRPTQIPVSFSDHCLALFAKEGNAGTAVTRPQLKKDKALREKYYAWWFTKRRQFLLALRDYLREKIPEAVVLFTPDASEPGRSIPGPGCVVTDDPKAWSPILANLPGKRKRIALSLEKAVRDNAQYSAVTSWPSDWGQWEVGHSRPPADPLNYRDVEGAMMTMSFNRAYTVGNTKCMEAFRSRSGLAMIRHYALNENMLDKIAGYFVADVDRVGPYCMLAEARAVAYGDPRYIGYLAAASFSRGFPYYVRRFNTAFLSLPALPSTVLKGAASDPSVVVREIKTEKHGTYYAIVNTGLIAAEKVSITLPAKGKIVNAATGESAKASAGKMELSFYPCELKAIHVKP